MRGIEIAAAWLLTYLLHSTLLLGAAWGLTRWGVRAYAGREVLWKAALLGGLLSATVQVAAGYQPLAGRLSVAPPAAAASVAGDRLGERTKALETAPDPAGDAEAASAAAVAEGVKEAKDAAAVAGPSPVGARKDATPSRPRRASPVVLAFVAAWALVALLLALRFLVAHLLLHVRIGPRALVRDAQLVELADLLREEAGLRRPVRLSRAAGLPSPIALGRSEICLPEAAIAELDHEQQESMLAHEVAHLARRDPAWLVVASLVERLLFVQPLNMLARRRIQEAAEYQCDDWAARRSGSGMTLAQCLLKVAEWIDATGEPVPLAGMSEVRSHFVERVDRLVAGRGLASRPASRWLAPAAVAVVLAVAAAAPAVTATADWPPPILLTHAWYMDQVGAGTSGSEGGTDVIASTTPAGSAPGAGPALINALGDPEPDVRAAAAQALGKRRQGAAVPALIAALRDGETAVRASAVEALAEIGDARALDGLLAALGDESAAVKAKAADAVGGLADDTGAAQRAAQALAPLLGDASVEVRRQAAEALSELEAARPIAALTAALADTDAEVRRTAAGALGDLGARQAGAKLVPLLGDPDAEVRRAAADSLGELADPATAAPLARALEDRHPDVRRAAASSLAELGLTQAPPALLAALRDEHPDVRHAAAQAVGEMQDPRAVPGLIALLDDADGDVREAAVESLGEIHDTAAVDALVRAMKASDPQVRKRAADALGERN